MIIGRAPRIPGYEHLDAQSLIAGCVALFEGRPWRIDHVGLVYHRGRPLQVAIQARRWVLRTLIRRDFSVAWGTPCPIRVADAP